MHLLIATQSCLSHHLYSLLCAGDKKAVATPATEGKALKKKKRRLQEEGGGEGAAEKAAPASAPAKAQVKAGGKKRKRRHKAADADEAALLPEERERRRRQRELRELALRLRAQVGRFCALWCCCSQIAAALHGRLLANAIHVLGSLGKLLAPAPPGSELGSPFSFLTPACLEETVLCWMGVRPGSRAVGTACAASRHWLQGQHYNPKRARRQKEKEKERGHKPRRAVQVRGGWGCSRVAGVASGRPRAATELVRQGSGECWAGPRLGGLSREGLDLRWLLG